MKAIFFILFYTLACCTSAQQIPNGDFESWGLYNTWSLEPENWITSNNQLLTPVTQDINPYQGEWAMRVNVLPGLEGSVQQVATTSFDIDFIPEFFEFMVKTNVPEGDYFDNVSVTVEFRLSGESIYSETLGIFESIVEWQQQQLVLSAPGVDVDEVRIHIVAGYVYSMNAGSTDTWISVDDLKFMPVTSTDYSKNIQCMVYPIPCKNALSIVVSDQRFKATHIGVLDMSGRIILNQTFEPVLDLSAIPKGMYILRLSNENEVFIHRKIQVE